LGLVVGEQGGGFFPQAPGFRQFGGYRGGALVQNRTHHLGHALPNQDRDDQDEPNPNPEFGIAQHFHGQDSLTARAASAADTVSPVSRATMAMAASSAALITCPLACTRVAAMRASASAIACAASASAAALALAISAFRVWR